MINVVLKILKGVVALAAIGLIAAWSVISIWTIRAAFDSNTWLDPSARWFVWPLTVAWALAVLFLIGAIVEEER